MAVTFQLPSDLEHDLRAAIADLDAQAKESFLVDLYRRGKLSHITLSNALQLDRFQTEELLHKHNVTEDLGTVAEYLADVATLERLRNVGR